MSRLPILIRDNLTVLFFLLAPDVKCGDAGHGVVAKSENITANRSGGGSSSGTDVEDV